MGIRQLLGKLSQWPRISLGRIRTHGVDGVRWSLVYLYYALFIKRLSLSTFDRRGEPAYEQEWDVLIVLDACRADLMARVADGYPFVSEETTVSVASTSRTWLERTFAAEYSAEMARTAYVTGNPFSDAVLDPDKFGLLDEVWRYAWDEELGTIPPRALTDRAIRVGREDDFDRLVVHYMQPHFPSIPDPDLSSGIDPTELYSPWHNSVWERLKAGEITERAVWDAYERNLHHVLEEISLLLDNLDADRVVVTSDHGNAVGDWGFYGHDAGIPLRCLREVPWCVTTATDTGSHEPASYDHQSNDRSVQDQLSALGYT